MLVARLVVWGCPVATPLARVIVHHRRREGPGVRSLRHERVAAVDDLVTSACQARVMRGAVVGARPASLLLRQSFCLFQLFSEIDQL